VAPLRSHPSRTRRDRCPGVLRPWPASDGGLVRVRLVGGRISSTALVALSRVAREYGDGDLHLTARANLQLRALPLDRGTLPESVVTAIEDTGLLPSRAHDLVRNVLVSPLTGISGGRADLRPVAASLEAALLADPVLGGLPGRFLFTLDDGRGDLGDRAPDLGLVALDGRTAQLRVGPAFGQVVSLDGSPHALAALARRFVTARGTGADAAWHVAELASPLVPPLDPDPRVPEPGPPLAFGTHPGAEHVAVPDGVLTQALVTDLAARAPELVVTPWRGVVVPA
jgi:precorrin-3B synthase